MEKIMVLGIGNRLMMDDGIGIYVVEELFQLNRTSGIDYLVGESDINYCLQLIDKANVVIVVDAVYSGKKPSELSIYSFEQLLEQQQGLDISPHNAHLFHALYQQKGTIKGFLIGIEPSEIRFHIGLSEILQQKWNIIIKTVNCTIEKILDPEKV